MKKTRLTLVFVLMLLCVGLAFSLTSCKDDENIYTKDDVDSLIAELEAALTEKATENEAAITALKAEYAAKIAELEKANGDNESAIATLTASYTAKVAELEAKGEVIADALTKLQSDQEADRKKLEQAAEDNALAIAQLKSNYENEVESLNSSISSNTQKIASLESAMSNDIDELNANYSRQFSDINAIIASLQETDTGNIQRIAALEAQVAELLSRHEHSFGIWIECDDIFEHSLSYRICTECHELEWRGLCREHTFTTVTTPPTCTAQGYDTNTCSICNTVTYTNYTPLSHNYSTVYSFNESYHWYDCTTCDEIYGYEEHSVDDNNVCTVCNQPLQPTPGVVYLLSTDGTYAEVVDYTGTATNVMIAEEYNGAPVTTIGTQAFANKNISFAVIPQGVTTVKGMAFSNCTNLSQIILPDTIASIESGAFSNCTALKKVHITDIAKWCSIDFSSSNSNPLYYAEELYLGGELVSHITTFGTATEIKNYAFYGYASLKSVSASTEIKAIGSEAFRNCAELKSITIPNTVTSIGNYAFYNCTSLEDVNIPASVTIIGNGAFGSCSMLSSVLIEEGLTALGNNVFSNCTNLDSINIPDSIISVSATAFSNCYNLIVKENGIGYVDKWVISFDNTVAIPEIKSNTVGIADSAFKGATKIRSLTIPASVKYIGTDSFVNCSNLTNIIFEEDCSIVTLPKAVFYGCSALEHMTLPFVGGDKNATEASEATLFGYIFGTTSYQNSVATKQSYSSDNSTTYHLPANLTSVTILGGRLLYGSFYYCESLKNVVINSDVIESYVFFGCDLQEVTIGNKTTSIVGSFICCTVDNLTIGSNVTSITYGALLLAVINNITVSGENTAYKTIDGDLYSADEKTLVLLCAGKDEYVIPETVTTIAPGAFFGFCANQYTDSDGNVVHTSTVIFEAPTSWTTYNGDEHVAIDDIYVFIDDYRADLWWLSFERA